ncbi:hypothetical protein QBC45DRAFT_396209 [Copromyces sp. CBS 386.78]|nr:hypothetical protein QBC45DRAFT_396209 [Copromyces sp. CBS 386.78]
MAPTTYQKLLNKHIPIIGGSSGLGAGVAEASLAPGAFVTIASSPQSKIDATIARLRELYPEFSLKIQGIAVDISASASSSSSQHSGTEAEADTDPDTVLEHKLHHLFLPAPTLQPKPQEGQPPSHFRHTLPLLLAKVSLQHLTASPTSSLTLSSGTLAEKPSPAARSLVTPPAG